MQLSEAATLITLNALSPGGERKIVGAVDGTLVVIGNSDNAVRSCLEARRGTRPSMRTDTELLKVRANLTSDKTLGFGYISPANSAKLFSWAAPLLMGQAPGDQQLEQLLAVSAGQDSAWRRMDREFVEGWNRRSFSLLTRTGSCFTFATGFRNGGTR